MTSPPSLSPAARSLTKPKTMAWGLIFGIAGVLLLVLGLSGRATVAIVFGVIFLVVAAPLLPVAFRASARARKYNGDDWTLAETIANAFRDLTSRPASDGYARDSASAHIPGARVVELERHFDQQTSGQITGMLNHRFSMFGATFGGLVGGVGGSGGLGAINSSFMRGTISGISGAQMSMNTTTRDNLLGDALFSVLEFETPSGDSDTMRTISMSAPAAAAWIGDLVNNAAGSLGGSRTHSGTTVLRWTNSIVQAFAPSDVSYATDRLKALERNNDEARVTVTGQPVGRNAIIATRFEFPGGQDALIFPAQIPALLGEAIGRATSNATIAAGSSTRPGLPVG